MFVNGIDLIIERAIVPAASTYAIKSKLAARIVSLLDQRELTLRSAGVVTATQAADLSRIRQGKLERFTVDRLITILTRLDVDLEISLQIRSLGRHARAAGKRS